MRAGRIIGRVRPFCGAAAGIGPPFRLITLGNGPFALSGSGPLRAPCAKAGLGPEAAARPVNIGYLPDFAKFSLCNLRRFSTRTHMKCCSRASTIVLIMELREGELNKARLRLRSGDLTLYMLRFGAM